MVFWLYQKGFYSPTEHLRDFVFDTQQRSWLTKANPPYTEGKMIKELSSSEYQVNRFDKIREVRHMEWSAFHTDFNVIQMHSTTVMSPLLVRVASPTPTLESELKSSGSQLSMDITQREREKGRPMRDARAQETTMHICSLRWWNLGICLIQSAYLSKGWEKKEGTAKIQLQQCLLLNQKNNGTKKGRTPRKRRAWDGGGKNHMNSDNRKC